MAKKKKDWGENSKATEARGRKAAAKAQEKEAAARRNDDAYWAAAGDGAKTKAQQKREEAEQKRLEAARRREEARKLAAAEEAAMASGPKRASRPSAPKVTHHELRLQRETQRKAEQEAAQERQKASKNIVDAEAYERMVDVANTNREDKLVDASGVDQALAALTVEEQKEDKHPERRRKAAYLAYEERELARLQKEKPNLKHSQYKDMIFKLWQKSPENPMNAIK